MRWYNDVNVTSLEVDAESVNESLRKAYEELMTRKMARVVSLSLRKEFKLVSGFEMCVFEMWSLQDVDALGFENLRLWLPLTANIFSLHASPHGRCEKLFVCAK